MSAAPPTVEQSRIDTAYQAQRLRLNATVAAAVASAWATQHEDRNATIAHAVRLVTAGQKHTVQLVGAYMSAKSIEATGSRVRVALDPAKYTTHALRGVAADAVYGRPFGAYGAFVKDGGNPSEAVQAALASVRKLAATDLQLAQTHSARDWMQTALEQAVDGVRIVGYRRVLTGPGPHCALCTAASTRTYRIADLMAIHEHCVIGNTLVAAAVAGESAERGSLAMRHGSIREVTRRWYRGEIIRIRTASGHELTVTPNHPILTAEGWVPAGLLHEGDHVLSSRDGERIVGRVPHEDEIPARIEDRFTAARVRGFVRVPFTAEDFHGDRGNGEVDVVATDGELRNRLQPSLAEPLMHLAFAVGREPSVALAGGGGLAEMVICGASSAYRGVGGGGDLLAALGAEGAHSHSGRLAEASTLDTGLIERAADHVAIHAEGLCERHRGLAREVSAHDCPTIESDALRAGALGNSHAASVDLRADGVLADTRGGRSLADRLAAQVQADRVVELRRDDWSGHVFNLHTVEGWYSANGIVTHNCSCTVQALWGTEPVASIGTTVRVEDDPEIGPRLMADDWSPVGPRLTAYEEPKATISLGSLDVSPLAA